MKYTTIPNTNIKVSKICLGTMTFGQQNTEIEVHKQRYSVSFRHSELKNTILKKIKQIGIASIEYKYC